MQIERTGNGRDLTIVVANEDETERLGRALARIVGPGTVIGMVGPLGAGKTRLVRAIAEALGADPGAIASPTFVLIHEYDARPPIVHVDVYRLGGSDELEALGIDDYFAAGGVCLIEWADRVADILPVDSWTVRIEPVDQHARRVTVIFPEGPPFSELPGHVECLLRPPPSI
jgi:tRNA threonylcarbamoyladenosine biosynthesis protein TsaE